MLPIEVEPFANAHRDSLASKSDTIQHFLKNNDGDKIEIPRSLLEIWAKEMDEHHDAFTRFRECMKGEQRSKQNAFDQLRQLREQNRK